MARLIPPAPGKEVVREAARFGTVGSLSAVVDVGVFNLLHFGAGIGPLTSKTLAVITATLVSYTGNRWWSFNRRLGGRHRRDLLVYAALNGAGLLIALAVLGFVRYGLGLTGWLALNALGNGGGILLASVFRFWAYRKFVFRLQAPGVVSRSTPSPHGRGTTESPSPHLIDEADVAVYQGMVSPDAPSPMPLTGAVREYSWGSRTALFEFLNRPPTGRPAAEYWLGAHPAAPALLHAVGIGPIPLNDYLGRHPHLLGEHRQLPFLLKVLAVERPLSLQVHPNRSQAAAGFVGEEAAGVELSSPRRRYRDANPKPELLVALTPFRMLAGIRDPAASLEVVDGLGCRPLARICTPLERDPTSVGVRAVLERVLTLDPPDARSMDEALSEAVASIGQGEGDAESDPVRRAADLVRILRAAHPQDVGVLAALLCNDITLAPQAAAFQPPGRLHACVRGLGVEVMASSDNVIRGGLTNKHVDVPEFLRVVDPTPDAGEVLLAQQHDSTATWPVPAAEFVLQRVDVAAAPVRVPGIGPRVLLVTCGSLELVHSETHGRPCVLGQGEAAFVPAGVPLQLQGHGTAFCAASRASNDRAMTSTSTTNVFMPSPRSVAEPMRSKSSR